MSNCPVASCVLGKAPNAFRGQLKPLSMWPLIKSWTSCPEPLYGSSFARGLESLLIKPPLRGNACPLSWRFCLPLPCPEPNTVHVRQGCSDGCKRLDPGSKGGSPPHCLCQLAQSTSSLRCPRCKTGAIIPPLLNNKPEVCLCQPARYNLVSSTAFAQRWEWCPAQRQGPDTGEGSAAPRPRAQNVRKHPLRSL